MQETRLVLSVRPKQQRRQRSRCLQLRRRSVAGVHLYDRSFFIALSDTGVVGRLIADERLLSFVGVSARRHRSSEIGPLVPRFFNHVHGSAVARLGEIVGVLVGDIGHRRAGQQYRYPNEKPHTLDD